ncbi:MAG TPA: NAD(P)/FAD-dependent oxidoreductase [Solirubrobacteraceae bacterium]|nr:NAD(P)/FAD-dependent oxidoreductase [Solirubrobacteraceae bacterium]
MQAVHRDQQHVLDSVPITAYMERHHHGRCRAVNSGNSWVGATIHLNLGAGRLRCSEDDHAIPGRHVTGGVVVVGGGFGGLQAALGLRRSGVEVTLIDRRNFHLFQPLTYQVATGALSPADVAYPLRAMFKSAPNVEVVLAEVDDFNLEAREVHLSPTPGLGSAPAALPYDTLVVAAGSSYSYFGHDDWREFAAEVKTLESAVAVRAHILRAFEEAEMSSDPRERDALMTFVVVGAGPTGVEMAGQIAELAHDTLRGEFRVIDPRRAPVVLVDTVDRVLQTFPPSLSAKAARDLRRIGVTMLTEHTVVGVDEHAVTMSDAAGAVTRIETRTVIWAAGVTASHLATRLSEQSGAELDAAGRVAVGSDLTLPGHPEVIALGDMVRVRDQTGQPVTLPGVAPVAIQQGRYAARLIRDRQSNQATPPFQYHDKGNVATIGRGRAVADVRLVRLSGLPAWIVWLVVHLWYLIGFQNRIVVMIRWSFSFFTHGRSARVIDSPPAGVPGLVAAGTPAREDG